MTEPREGIASRRLQRVAPDSTEDLRRMESRIAVARSVAVPWTFLQVLVYHTQPYPPGVKTQGLLLAAALLVGDVAILVARSRVRTADAARRLSLAALTFDVLVASGFVWLYTFDQSSALWAILFILPLEGAARFGVAGAVGTWAAVTALYVGREIWGSGRYDYPLAFDSISFRMGLALIIGLVGGLAFRDLNRERRRLALALEELGRVDQLRSALVSTLAHDVRNPLAAIRAALATLMRRRERLDSSQVGELLERTDLQADRLERLALGLLDLAQVEQGRLPLTIGDVPLLEAVERGLSFVDGGRAIETRIDASLTVRADAERLEQIVVNLAANCIAYGEPPLLVSAGRSGNMVAIDFVDHGDGVPDDQMETLFSPFGARVGRGSVGLGLAIVSALTEAQGGRVSYEENDPRGARFRVELPAGSRPPARIEEPAAEASPGR
jgi:signal transduction histidine kinase